MWGSAGGGKARLERRGSTLQLSPAGEPGAPRGRDGFDDVLLPSRLGQAGHMHASVVVSKKDGLIVLMCV